MKLGAKIEVIERPPVKVAYLRYTGPFGEPLYRFWRTTMAPWLADHGLVDCPRYGVPLDGFGAAPPEKCRYDACVQLPAGLIIPETPETTIPGGRYAVTRFQGTAAEIGAAWSAFVGAAQSDAANQVDSQRRPHEHYPRGAPYDARTGMFSCELCLPIEAPALSIERATPDDAAHILELQKLAYQSEARLYGDDSLPPLTQTLASLREEMAVSVVLKASSGASLVGSVRAREREGICHVARLIVHPAFQGRGIGTQLMSEIEAAFPACARFQLFTGSRSQGNLRLYRRLGYRHTHDQALSPAVTLSFLEKSR